LVAPRLAPTRRRVLAAVADLCQDRDEAAAALRLPPAAVDGAVAANRRAATAPTMPALDRFQGVIYTELAPATMTRAVRAVADECCLVFSGLLGLIRGGDAVPDHRVPVAATLPALGALTPVWRAALREAMPPLLGRTFAVDLRSTDYAAMWAPTGPVRHQVLAVRVLSRRPSGALRVVSHFSKQGKGRLARALLERAGVGQRVEGIEDVASVAAGLGWECTTRRGVGGVAALDVVLPEGPVAARG
jgi:cytoplasmic iron level regulating protein YaaA (DUF328/UPF0246 family)